MSSLIEPLLTLAIGIALAVSTLMRGRGREGSRAQIKQDVELREMLNKSPSVDDEARAALTISIRNNAQMLVSDEPDWFDRWGIQWIVPISLVLFFTGTNLRGTVDDFETSSGTQLALEVTGQTMMLIAGPLLGMWIGRLFVPVMFQWSERRKQRRAKDRSSQTD